MNDRRKFASARTWALPLCLLLTGLAARGDDPVNKGEARPADPKQAQERTSFQSGAPFDPMIDLRSDVVMCYGLPFAPRDIARNRDESERDGARRTEVPSHKGRARCFGRRCRSDFAGSARRVPEAGNREVEQGRSRRRHQTGLMNGAASA